MDANDKKKGFSLLKKRLRERVKNCKEPFKGTLASKRGNLFSDEEVAEQPSKDEREQRGKGSFEMRLRESVNTRTEPFKGCMGERVNTRTEHYKGSMANRTEHYKGSMANISK